MKLKQIQWSYPTSENAKSMGFEKTGCWTVSFFPKHGYPKAQAGFDTVVEAIAFASVFPHIRFGRPWRKYDIAPSVSASFRSIDSKKFLWDGEIAFANQHVSGSFDIQWFPSQDYLDRYTLGKNQGSCIRERVFE